MKCGPLDTFKAKPWAQGMRDMKTSASLTSGSITSTETGLVNGKVQESPFTIGMLSNGAMHIKFNCQKVHFDVSADDSVILQSELKKTIKGTVKATNASTTIDFGDVEAAVQHHPFDIQVCNKTRPGSVTFNRRETLDVDRNSFDVTFDNNWLVGLAARDSCILLTPTIRGAEVVSDPYRIFNCDTGEFRPPKTFSVYGAINFLQSENSAVFVANSSDTFVDVIDDGESTGAHFVSARGPVDLFVFLGTRAETTHAFSMLIGRSFFPSLIDFGFNHCKWGMKTQKEVEDIMDLYESSGTLYDKMWLDIDHLIGQQPFTVDKETFPDIDGLKARLAKHGRRLAIIQDPHLPHGKDHAIADDCQAQGLTVKNAKGEVFVGPCWPGESVYPDFISPEARAWWGRQVPTDVSLWNDMNEPSVFTDTTENTMPIDNLHCGGLTHECVHNIYGHFHTLASTEGVKSKSDIRPFVLTRSYFAGTQRHTAVWTGDCPSSFHDLRVSVHQVCTASTCGMAFIGADIGGFFGSPTQEFIELWLANAVWVYPFLRIHAHIDSASRHGVVAGSARIASDLKERYEMLPYWYMTFYENHTKLTPVVRFCWFDHPEIDHTNEQVFVGRSLMVVPVIYEDMKEVEVVCPPGTEWVNYRTFTRLSTNEKVDCSSSIPVFIRVGSVIPLFAKPVRSTAETRVGGMRLLIVSGDDGKAEGELYIDDGATRAFESGMFLRSKITFNNGVLSNEILHSGYTDFSAITCISLLRSGVKSDTTPATALSASEPWTISLG